jgi:hypothetical protein
MTEFCVAQIKLGNAVRCCLHDLADNHEHAPGRVCCWCGDIFMPYSETTEHGQFKPVAVKPVVKPVVPTRRMLDMLK